MTEEITLVHARRFARAALNIYESQGRFDITPERDDLDAVASAFVELGCAVSTDYYKGTLTVVCPRPIP